MSANAHLIESMTRHQVYLQRRGASMANDVIPMVERIIKTAAERTANTEDQRARQQALIASLNELITDESAGIRDKLESDAQELAEYESDYYLRSVGSVVSASLAAPAAEQLAAVATTATLDTQIGRGETIRQAIERFSTSMQGNVRQTILDGIVEQRTNAQISGDISNMTPRIKRQADALTRTVANAAADEAKRITAENNRDVLKGEKYVATLDARTTRTCISLDGDIYPLDEGPRPPLHYNCRSVRVAQVRDDLALEGFDGERPFVADGEKGQVSARTTYHGFLKRQSTEFQDDVLGRETAKLWREGKVALSDLTNRFGEPLTLAELKAKEGLQ